VVMPLMYISLLIEQYQTCWCTTPLATDKEHQFVRKNKS
jgi:hypothetical protein